jgi:hypothetical protein
MAVGALAVAILGLIISGFSFWFSWLNRPRVKVKLRFAIEKQQGIPQEDKIALTIINDTDNSIRPRTAVFMFSGNIPVHHILGTKDMEPRSSLTYILPMQEIKDVATKRNKKLKYVIVIDELEKRYEAKPVDLLRKELAEKSTAIS